MGDNNVCPICGHDINSLYCAHSRRDFATEIARLKAALEQAERDKSDMWKNLRASIADHSKTIRERDEARKLLPGKIGLLQHYIAERDEALENVEQMRSATLTALNSSDKVSRLFLAERDEARRWAGRFYREYLAAQRYFDNLFDESNKGTNDNA